MTRLEKKCFLASAGLHGLLVLIILFGAAFLGPAREKPLINRMTVIPSKLVDAALNGGGGNPNLARTDEQVKGNSLNPADNSSAPLPPTPPPRPLEVRARETPQPQARPQPPNRQETVRPDPPKSTAVKPPDNPNTAVKTPAPTAPTLDLVPTVRGPSPKDKAKAEAEARAAQRQAEQRRELASQIAKAASGLKAGFKEGTQVDVGGPGGEAYANYASFIQAAYDQAWRVLPDLATLDHVVTVEVVIARNGRVVSQRIVSRSGNSAMDRSVQNALDRVKQQGLPAFPEGARDAEREFTIQFNLKARRLVG